MLRICLLKHFLRYILNILHYWYRKYRYIFHACHTFVLKIKNDFDLDSSANFLINFKKQDIRTQLSGP
jgi:hypothetical protein